MPRKGSWTSRLKYIIVALLAGLTITGSPVNVVPVDPVAYTYAKYVHPLYRGSGVRVAIIDTGANFYSYELYHKIDPEFINLDHFDFCGHGTYTASLVAAIAPEAILLPYRVSGVCSGSYSKMGEAIIDAYSRGVRIVVITQAGKFKHTPLQNIINEYSQRGMLIIASAGNTGADEPIYPGAFDNVFTIGNIGQDGEVFTSSTYGPQIDLLAPGHAVRGLYYWPEEATTSSITLNGTSASAPIVAGFAALLLNKYPDMTNEEIIRRMQGTGTEVYYRGYAYRSLDAIKLFGISVLHLPIMHKMEKLEFLQCTPPIYYTC